MRRAFRARLAVLAAACALAACEHAQPFGAPPAEPNVPFGTGYPRRLTFSPGADFLPAWLPDDSEIVYSYQLPQADGDQCLGILPAEGGHLTGSICHVPPARDADSTNILTEPAPGPLGALAYLRTSQALGSQAPNSIELVAATLDSPQPGRTALRVPYTGPDSVLYVRVSHLRWVDAHTLVYLAQGAVYTDTSTAPFDLSTLDLSQDPAVVAVLPGTAGATSVAVDSGAVYYTVAGEARVFRYRAGAAPDTVFDFGAAGAAVEVQVRGTVLVAYAGGVLERVDTRSGAVAVVSVPSPSTGSPALSPSGTRLVVEAAPGISSPDLWLLEVP